MYEKRSYNSTDFPTLEKTLEFLDKFKEEKLFVKV